MLTAGWVSAGQNGCANFFANLKLINHLDLQLTVCICTYHREALLRKCLLSLWKQTVGVEQFKVLIVDNAGTQECQSLAEQFEAAYLVEPQIGLSYARNRGYQSINTDWILYLDDDAIARPDLIERLLAHLEKEDWVAIGGRFEHYFDELPPTWLTLEVGVGYEPYPGVQEVIELPSGAALVGGVMAFRVQMLLQLGGFNTNLGMTGHAFGYGEDDEIQLRIRGLGKALIYDPALVIDHYYHPRKYSLKAQLTMAYESGLAHGKMEAIHPDSAIVLLAKYLQLTFYQTPRTLAKWLIKRRDWHWQNAFLAIVKEYVFVTGAYRGLKLAKANRSAMKTV